MCWFALCFTGLDAFDSSAGSNCLMSLVFESSGDCPVVHGVLMLNGVLDIPGLAGFAGYDC